MIVDICEKGEVLSKYSKQSKLDKLFFVISRILKEDSAAFEPLFINVNELFVLNIIERILNRKQERFIISIAGESASGKTTFLQNSVKCCPKALNNAIYTIVSSDNYYYDWSEELKRLGGYEGLFSAGYSFDTPNAINIPLMKEHLSKLKNGQTIYSPDYDFVTCKSNMIGELKRPSLLILNEGLFTLNDAVVDVSDIKIYVHTPYDVIKERWYKRAVTRGKTGKAADMQFEIVNNAAEKYIRPTRESADVVVNGKVSPEYITLIINKIYFAIKMIFAD